MITRAELHEAHPERWPEIPDVPGVVVVEVKRAWVRELNVPAVWLRTECVDLSLTSLVRALITQQTGKDDAVAELEGWGVPGRPAMAIRARRNGREGLPHNSDRRAWQVRGEVKRLLARL